MFQRPIRTPSCPWFRPIRRASANGPCPRRFNASRLALFARATNCIVMFDAAVKALSQMFTQPLRRVLLKSVGLALLVIVIIGIGLQRLLAAMADSGATWAEQTAGFAPHSVWAALAWVLSILAGL